MLPTFVVSSSREKIIKAARAEHREVMEEKK